MTENKHHAALLDLALQAADQARTISLPRFRVGIDFDEKAAQHVDGEPKDIDPVTEADIQSERVIRDVLSAAGNEVGFLGEESGAANTVPSDGLCWVVDPIDGTRAFICGVPLWSSLIALCENGVPVFGVVDFPALSERYVGAGARAWSVQERGEVAATVRRGRPLSEALMCCTTPDMFERADQREGFERVRDSVALTRFGTDAYGFALLASGQTDIVIESGLAPWDVAAVAALVRSAGGVITDWSGNSGLSSGSIVATSDSALHAEALACLSRPS